MNRHNARSLLITSFVTIILVSLLSLYPENDGGGSRRLYYIFATTGLCVFIYARVISLQKPLNGALVTLGILLFTLNLLTFALFVFIFDKSPYVMRFLIFFMSFEVIFILGSLFCVFYNIFILVAFSLSYIISDRVLGLKIPNEQYFDILNVAIACIISGTFNWYVSYVFIKNFITTHTLEEEKNRYHEESMHDQLTTLNNRRSFDESIDFFTTVCRNVHQTVCVVMMDIDFFKKYNDFYGHTKGDDVLKAVGAVLKSVVKENGVFAARVGGEEFIVIWTENRLIEAERVVLKIRQRIIDLQIPHQESSVSPYVTASFGLYVMRGGSLDSPKELYEAADSALYKAKESGRNKIVLLDSTDRKFKDIELRHPDDLPRR